MGTHIGSILRWASLPAVVLFTTSSALAAVSDGKVREGRAVVDAACGACHVSGKDGAPKIGDRAAWAARTAQGLSSLTASAIVGIRKMPAHGGDLGVSDVELQRAIVYMVNNSGGHWVEPRVKGVARTSEAVVGNYCGKCHEAGTEGAPKIGDRAAWTPRLSKGLDTLVDSAVHGHGGMPARGGLPDLERDEIRGAVLYMFNYGLPPAPVAPPEAAAAADPRHKVASGMDVYFGVMPAASLRDMRTGDRVKVSVPSGRDYYHLNISVTDRRTKAPVSDAQVTVKVSDGMTVQSKKLALLATNQVVSYGEFIKFTSGGAYNIETQIRRPGKAPVVTNFEYRAP